ncbi:MAG: hypothetical protein GY730_04090, partial [bacterium]|nr:hypothetical protein [bacterium]
CRSLVRGYVKDKSEGNNDNKHVYVPYDIITVLSTYLYFSLAKIADTMNKDLKIWLDEFNAVLIGDQGKNSVKFCAEFSCENKEINFSFELTTGDLPGHLMEVCNYLSNYAADLTWQHQNLKTNTNTGAALSTGLQKNIITNTKDTLKVSLTALTALHCVAKNICQAIYNQMIDNYDEIFEPFQFRKDLHSVIAIYRAYKFSDYEAALNKFGEIEKSNLITTINKNINEKYDSFISSSDPPVECTGINIEENAYVYFKMEFRQEKEDTGIDDTNSDNTLPVYYYFSMPPSIDMSYQINIDSDYCEETSAICSYMLVTIADIFQIIHNCKTNARAFDYTQHSNFIMENYGKSDE